MPRPQANDFASSLRTQIRRGELAQTERADPSGPLDAREPDELFGGAEEIEFPPSCSRMHREIEATD